MKLPEFQCSLKLFFDNDYDVNEITKKLNISPNNCARYSESGYLKNNNKKCSGFWWRLYPNETEYKESWSVTEVLEDFFKIFSKKQVKDLINLVETNSGQVIVGINVYFQDDNLPELCFDGEIMEIIHSLNADIHININKDNE